MIQDKCRNVLLHYNRQSTRCNQNLKIRNLLVYGISILVKMCSLIMCTYVTFRKISAKIYNYTDRHITAGVAKSATKSKMIIHSVNRKHINIKITQLMTFDTS